MRPLFSAFALLSALALPAAAYADTFTASGSAGGFSGSAIFTATPNGNGSYTLTGISGLPAGQVLGLNTFYGNDNLLFPSAASLVDSKGFAFTLTEGNTDFNVDVASNGSGGYIANFLDSDNNSGSLPVNFSLTPTANPIPEPSSLVLLGTGVLAMTGAARRRLLA